MSIYKLHHTRCHTPERLTCEIEPDKTLDLFLNILECDHGADCIFKMFICHIDNNTGELCSVCPTCLYIKDGLIRGDLSMINNYNNIQCQHYEFINHLIENNYDELYNSMINCLDPMERDQLKNIIEYILVEFIDEYIGAYFFLILNIQWILNTMKIY